MGAAKNAKLDLRDQRAAARGQGGQSDGWRGFVNVELAEQDKAVLRAQETPFEDYWDGVIDRMVNGYKLSVSRDHRNDTWIASLTCNHPADPNKGYTLSGRGGTWMNAVTALAYKDRILLQGNWTSDHVVTARPGPSEFG